MGKKVLHNFYGIFFFLITVDKLIEIINRVTWKGINTKAILVFKEYKKGVMDKDDLKNLKESMFIEKKV